jgi:hypothetical protein
LEDEKENIFILSLSLLGITACVDDLNQYPNIEETSESVYAKPENYIKVLAKCYASYVTAGQEKGAVMPT